MLKQLPGKFVFQKVGIYIQNHYNMKKNMRIFSISSNVSQVSINTSAHSEKDLLNKFLEASRSFNKEEVQTAIRKCEEAKFCLHKLAPKELKNSIRRHGTIAYDFTQIGKDLRDRNLSLDTRLNMIIALKYGILNGAKIDSDALINAITCFEDKQINSELAYCLAFLLKNQDSAKSEDNLQRIRDKLDQNIKLTQEARDFLREQIKKTQNLSIKNASNIKQNFPILTDYKKPKASVMREQIKNKQKNIYSEESKIELLAIADALKNRKKKINSNKVQYKVPQTQQAEGSDRKYFSCCYTDIKNLYNSVSNGGILKKDDKDYLTKRLFRGFVKSWGSGGLLGNFIIDRMIVATFQKISNNQKLEQNALQLVENLCGDHTSVKKIFFNYQNNESIATILHAQWIPKPQDNNNDIEKNFVCIKKLFEDNKQYHLYFCKYRFGLNCYGGRKQQIINQITKIMDDQIKKIRLDAIKCIYNNARLTNGASIRKKQIRNKIHERVKDCDKEIAREAIKILTTIANDDEVDYKMLFKTYVENLDTEEKADTENFIQFIHSQSLDAKRCQELFTKEVVNKVLSFFIYKSAKVSANHQILLVESLNNYLECSSKHFIQDQNLLDFMDILIQDISKALRIQMLTMLLNAQKIKFFCSNVLQKFMYNIENIEQKDQTGKSSALIIFILEEIQKKKPLEQPELIAHMLNDKRVIVIEDKCITIEKREKSNKSLPSICFLTAKIIYNSLEHEINLTKKLFVSMVDNLNDSDKQTRIEISKALYKAEKINDIDQDSIKNLQLYLFDSVNDVSIYSKLAYVKFVKNYTLKNNDSINAGILENLTDIYSIDKLIFEGKDLTNSLNNNILEIFILESKKNSLKTEKVYDVLNHILIYDNDAQRQQLCLKILDNIIQKKLLLQDVIWSLQNFAHKNQYGDSQINKVVTKLLKKIIDNGQLVSDSTLTIFSDKLFLSKDDKEREDAFHILDNFEKNHNIFSQEIFEKIEIQRAAYSILNNPNCINHAINYLTKKTQEGKKLSLNTFKFLGHYLDDPSVLNLLIASTRNKELLPDIIFESIMERLELQQHQDQIICILENLIKNGRVITEKHLRVLEKNSLIESKNQDKLLNILANLIQKGQNASGKIITVVCIKLITGNRSFTENFIRVLISLSKRESSNKEFIKEAFLKKLDDENSKISVLAAEGIYIIKNSLIEEDKYLITKIISSQRLPKEANNFLARALKAIQAPHQKNYLLDLINLNDKPDTEFLERLSELAQIVNLIKESFDRLANMLDKSVYMGEVMAILQKCINKSEFSDKIQLALSSLFIRTDSLSIRRKSYEILEQTIKNGKKLSNEALETIFRKKDFQLILPLLEQIQKNQQLPKMLQLSLKLFRSNISISNLTELLNELYLSIKKGRFILNENLFQKLLQLNNSNSCKFSYANQQKIIQIITASLLFGNINDSIFHFKLFQTIEEFLLSNKINLNNPEVLDTIEAYQANIGKFFKKCKLPKILQNLIQLKNKNKILQTKPAILSLICEASKYIDLPKICINMLQQQGLNNSNSRIRSLTFKSLKLAEQKGYQLKQFKKYIKNIEKQLFKRQLKNISEINMNLIGILASLDSIDYDVLKNNDPKDWKRSLLISNLKSKFHLEGSEISELQAKCLDLENRIGIDNFEYLLVTINSQPDLKYNIVKIILSSINNLQLRALKSIIKRSKNIEKNLSLEILQSKLSNILQNVCKEYINNLAEQINQKLPFPTANKLIDSIFKINNIKEFHELVNFIYFNRLTEQDIQKTDAPIEEMLKTLQIKVLSKKLKINQKPSNKFKLVSTINNLFNYKWKFDELNKLFQYVGSSDIQKDIKKEKILLNIIQILSDYKISSQNVSLNDLEEILQKKKTEQWISQIYKIVVRCKFSEQPILCSAQDLLASLSQLNSNNQYLTNEKLRQLKRKLIVVKNYTDISELSTSNKSIPNWTNQDIQRWAQQAKKKKDKFNDSQFLLETLAVIYQANILFASHVLRDTQIISALLLLDPQLNQGRLLQVSTGQGKSTVSSILAIVKALQGQKVDIITSSPVLAERDAKEKAALYKMFGLTCSDNNDRSLYNQGPKLCYKQDIVYGETSQFQFDTLRDNYSGLKTLGDRKKQVAIVDEVDSILIDDSSKIARLATIVPGIEQMQPIYHFMWHRLTSLQEKILQIDGNMYFMYGKLKSCQNSVKLTFEDEKGQIVEIKDLKDFIRSVRDISQIGRLIEGDIENFMKNELKRYIQQLIDFSHNSQNQNKLKIPKNFQQFAKTQISKWTDSAITAFSYQENIQYIVQNGAIKPVDYNSTGIVHSATNWSDGLHQFLQIKHGLKMTSESLTTNFLSNMGYFKKYGKNLYGLTGTLGSSKAKQILREVYKIDLLKIPSSCKKQYIRFPSILIKNNRQFWLRQITTSAINESHKNRGTLIICETIENVKEIASILKQKYRAEAIKLYNMNDINQEREIQKIYPGEIIVATNLAGRGTDIKTDDIEEFGGMHLIVTFMPPNQRVEDQAFGRTARQGRRGTGQMILNCSLIRHESMQEKFIKESRDTLQANSLENFKNTELQIIKLKDKLFERFCQLIGYLRAEIRKHYRNSCEITNSIKNEIKQIFGNSSSSVYEENILAAVEEQWAMFLRKIDDQTIHIDSVENQYKNFQNGLFKILNKEAKNNKGIFNIIKNPYYHIVIANDIVKNNSGTHEIAYQHFQKAIQKDPNFCASAHLGKAWMLIHYKKIFNNSINKSYKQEALKELQKSLQKISEEMGVLGCLQALTAQTISLESDLSKQLIQKMNILGSFMNSIESNINQIKNALRSLDITIQHKNENQQIFHNGLVRNGEGKIQLVPQRNTQSLVLFNNLTLREDAGIKIDQAISTIDQLKKFQNQIVLISANSISADKIKDILNPDVEIKNLTKKDALQQMNNEVGFLCMHIFPERWSSSYQSIKLRVKNERDQIIDTKVFQYERALAQKGTCKKVIEYINEFNDVATLYDLTFFNGNDKRSTKFRETVNESLNIEFLNIKVNDVENKINCMRGCFSSIDVTINNYLIDKTIELLRSQRLTNEVKMKIIKKDNASAFYAKQSLREIEQNKSSIQQIKFQNLSFESAKSILSLYKSLDEGDPHLIFNVTFNSVFIKDTTKLKQIVDNLQSEQINLSFVKLDKEVSKQIIDLLRKEGIDFKLGFKGIKSSELNDLIIKSYKSQPQEEIEIKSVNSLSQMFLPEMSPNIELDEFAARGIQYLLAIGEKRFIPWRSVASLAFLTAAQLAVGGVLVCTGLGSTVGMGIIAEGVADAITTFRTVYTRQFSWSEYCKQKAISLTISAATMGLTLIKNGGKGAKILAELGQQAMEKAGSQLVKNSKIIAPTINISRNNIISQLPKKIGILTGKAVIREGLNAGVGKLSQFTFDWLKPKILDIIQLKVQNKFYESSFMPLLKKTLALDSIGIQFSDEIKIVNQKNKSNRLKSRINNQVLKTLNPEKNWFRKNLDTTIEPLCKGILSSENLLGSPFSVSMRIIGIINGSYQIYTIIDVVHNDLNKKLSNIKKETLSKLLQSYAGICLHDANHLYTEIQYQNAARPQHILEDSWKRAQKLMREVDQISNKMELQDLSEVIKAVSGSLTNHIIKTLESQLITPSSSFLTGVLVNKGLSKLQNLIMQTELSLEKLQMKSQENNIEQKQNKIESLAKIQQINKEELFENHQEKIQLIALNDCMTQAKSFNNLQIENKLQIESNNQNAQISVCDEEL